MCRKISKEIKNTVTRRFNQARNISFLQPISSYKETYKNNKESWRRIKHNNSDCLIVQPFFELKGFRLCYFPDGGNLTHRLLVSRKGHTQQWRFLFDKKPSKCVSGYAQCRVPQLPITICGLNYYSLTCKAYLAVIVFIYPQYFLRPIQPITQHHIFKVLFYTFSGVINIYVPIIMPNYNFLLLRISDLSHGQADGRFLPYL